MITGYRALRRRATRNTHTHMRTIWPVRRCQRAQNSSRRHSAQRTLCARARATHDMSHLAADGRHTLAHTGTTFYNYHFTENAQCVCAVSQCAGVRKPLTTGCFGAHCFCCAYTRLRSARAQTLTNYTHARRGNAINPAGARVCSRAQAHTKKKHNHI